MEPVLEKYAAFYGNGFRIIPNSSVWWR